MKSLAIVCLLATPAFAQTPSSETEVAASWPAEISGRPWNLDAGMLELHGALPIFGTNYSGGSNASTEIFAGGGIAYGVSRELELGGDYAFEAKPSTDAA